MKSITDALDRWVLPETLILAAICVADMLYTLIAVRIGLARETNPILARTLLDPSNISFVVIKSFSFLLPLAILELLRPRNPKLIARALRLAVAMYIVMYLIGSIGLHLMA